MNDFPFVEWVVNAIKELLITQTYSVILNGKRGNEFKTEKGGVYGKCSREMRKREIMLLYYNLIK